MVAALLRRWSSSASSRYERAEHWMGFNVHTLRIMNKDNYYCLTGTISLPETSLTNINYYYCYFNNSL